MDYEKKYNEALKDMRAIYPNLKGDARLAVEHAFPELAESHDDILKLFCEDGSHYEVPVGAWIVKTPDGYNTPSRFRFIQKPAEWSRQSIIDALTKWLTDKIAPLHKKSLDGTITEREEMFRAALLEMRSLINSPDFQIGKDTLAEWSEEDEKMLVSFLHKVEVCDLLTNKEYAWIVKRLKSLHPVKQEWSEEDENALKYLHELISFGYTEKFFDAQTAADMREWVNEKLKKI